MISESGRMSTPNPMAGSMDGSFPSPPSPVSIKTFTIAGILVTVHGLDELSPKVQRIACLWLLHPRLQTQKCMAPLAAAGLHHWNQSEENEKIGLIAVTFDQRNHGSRELDPLSNEAWRSGNERHAQDMFSTYRPPFNSSLTSIMADFFQMEPRLTLLFSSHICHHTSFLLRTARSIPTLCSVSVWAAMLLGNVFSMILACRLPSL